MGNTKSSVERSANNSFRSRLRRFGNYRFFLFLIAFALLLTLCLITSPSSRIFLRSVSNTETLTFVNRSSVVLDDGSELLELHSSVSTTPMHDLAPEEHFASTVETSESSLSRESNLPSELPAVVRVELVEKAEFRHAVHLIVNGTSNFDPFRYLVEPSACSESKFAKIIVYVAVPPNLASLRQVVREAWGNDAKQRNIEVVFALGRASANESLGYMDVLTALEENKRYGDILMPNYEDTYKHLIVKYWTNLHYHVTRCFHIPFMIHIDVDTVIYPENLEYFISHNANDYLDGLACQVFVNMRETRVNHQWYVSEDQWPFDKLHQYCHGIFILSSTLTTVKLVEAVPKLGIDYFTSFGIWDVVTGPLAKIAGVPLRGMPGLHGSFSLATACEKSSVAVHPVKEPGRISSIMSFRKRCCSGGHVICNSTELPPDQKWIMS